MAKSIYFDRTTNNFVIESDTDYSLLPDIDLSVPVEGGIEILIDGNEYYDNSSIAFVNYSIDITNTPNNVVTQVNQAPLPSDADGNVVVGGYEFTTYDRYTTLSTGTAITQEGNNFSYGGQIDKSICINDAYSCVAPSIVVYDVADYNVGTVEPNVEAAELKLTYPDSSMIAPITATTLPLQIDTATVYTKDYRINETLTLLYDMTDYFERIGLEAEGGFNVKCDTLCSVSKCINSFKTEMDAAKGVNDTKYQKLKADYNYIMSLSTQIANENACGERDNIPALLDEITSVINAADCKTNCTDSCGISGVSERVYGLGNAISGDSLLNTNDGTVFSPQTSEIVFSPDGLNFSSDGAGKVTVEAEVKPSDVVSQTYIDTQDNLRVLKAGDTMTGTLSGTDINLTGRIDAPTADLGDVDVTGSLTGVNATLSGEIQSNMLLATLKAVFGDTGNPNGMTLNVIPSGNGQFARVAFSNFGDENTKSFVGVNTLNSNNLQLGIANQAWVELIQATNTVNIDKNANITGNLTGTSADFSANITASTPPTAAGHLTNKTFVDAQDALKVSKTGDTMTGTLVGVDIDLSGDLTADVVNPSIVILRDGIGGNADFAVSTTTEFVIGDGGKEVIIASPKILNGDNNVLQSANGGTTANRPNSPENFQQYFDTNLNGGKGYLIVYNNGDWFDPLGNIV